MAGSDKRIEVLEDELKLLKGEVKRTLVDLRAFVMREDSPINDRAASYQEQPRARSDERDGGAAATPKADSDRKVESLEEELRSQRTESDRRVVALEDDLRSLRNKDVGATTPLPQQVTPNVSVQQPYPVAPVQQPPPWMSYPPPVPQAPAPPIPQAPAPAVEMRQQPQPNYQMVSRQVTRQHQEAAPHTEDYRPQTPQVREDLIQDLDRTDSEYVWNETRIPPQGLGPRPPSLALEEENGQGAEAPVRPSMRRKLQRWEAEDMQEEGPPVANGLPRAGPISQANLGTGSLDVNLVSNLMRWACQAKKRLGHESLLDFLELYMRSGLQSKDLSETIVYVCTMVEHDQACESDPVFEWVDLIHQLHGILAGAVPITYESKARVGEGNGSGKPEGLFGRGD